MREFDDCTDGEREALDQLSEGALVESIDPTIVKSLTEKYMLEDFQGNLILPALVWVRWKKYKEG